jgi:plasmid stability protein
MSQILVRNLDTKAVNRLKARAKQHGRSLQGEARLLLERAVGVGAAEVAAMLDGWKERLAGRRFGSSAKLIREDRDR